jgi:hypothetical protein
LEHCMGKMTKKEQREGHHLLKDLHMSFVDFGI